MTTWPPTASSTSLNLLLKKNYYPDSSFSKQTLTEFQPPYSRPYICATIHTITKVINSFIPHAVILVISIAPLQSTTTKKHSRLQHGYCIGVSRRSSQATVSKRLALGP